MLDVLDFVGNTVGRSPLFRRVVIEKAFRVPGCSRVLNRVVGDREGHLREAVEHLAIVLVEESETFSLYQDCRIARRSLVNHEKPYGQITELKTRTLVNFRNVKTEPLQLAGEKLVSEPGNCDFKAARQCREELSIKVIAVLVREEKERILSEQRGTGTLGEVMVRRILHP